MFWPFTVRTNWSSVLKIFANSRPSASNAKNFSQSHTRAFFLTVSQNNFGNKIPFMVLSWKVFLAFCCHLGFFFGYFWSFLALAAHYFASVTQNFVLFFRCFGLVFLSGNHWPLFSLFCRNIFYGCLLCFFPPKWSGCAILQKKTSQTNIKWKCSGVSAGCLIIKWTYTL